jgi:hypothetical protein
MAALGSWRQITLESGNGEWTKMTKIISILDLLSVSSESFFQYIANAIH